MSVILVIVADKGKPHYALIAVVPTFYFLYSTHTTWLLRAFFTSAYLLLGERIAEQIFVTYPIGGGGADQPLAYGRFSITPRRKRNLRRRGTDAHSILNNSRSTRCILSNPVFVTNTSSPTCTPAF